MRFILFICGAALLSACASVAAPAAPIGQKSGLPSSELAAGECGLFGWSTNEARQFIFYADEKTARYSDGTKPVDLTAQSAFPATTYTDPNGKAVTLRLGAGEDMIGGERYPSARIVSLTDEGWEKLQPVAIVKTCRPK